VVYLQPSAGPFQLQIQIIRYAPQCQCINSHRQRHRQLPTRMPLPCRRLVQDKERFPVQSCKVRVQHFIRNATGWRMAVALRVPMGMPMGIRSRRRERERSWMGLGVWRRMRVRSMRMRSRM
jgi:hypothetical protein